MAAGLTVVIDYGLCNLDSMVRALEECGASRVERTRDPRLVDRADRIVLPGVGTFAVAMRNLAEWRLLDAIRDATARGGVPFLGACLGMQLMATHGMEGAGNEAVEGIGLIEGDVVKLQARKADERIPHIGWNDVTVKSGSALFRNCAPGSDFYFVHSYHVSLADPKDEVGRTEYCGGFSAAIEAADRLIFGTQFHPEKSQKNGFRLLKNYLAV